MEYLPAPKFEYLSTHEELGEDPEARSWDITLPSGEHLRGYESEEFCRPEFLPDERVIQMPRKVHRKSSGWLHEMGHAETISPSMATPYFRLSSKWSIYLEFLAAYRAMAISRTHEVKTQAKEDLDFIREMGYDMGIRDADMLLIEREAMLDSGYARIHRRRK